MIASILTWLTSPSSWAGPDGIPARVFEHLWLTLLVLALAAVIAIPIGLLVGHTGRMRWLVVAANSARAVPTLGLLFIGALWLAPLVGGSLAFTVPAVAVLVLLAIPPILSGTYAGVEAVDPAARDAAAGLGMTSGEILTQVEMPMALPLLWSGLRAATLQVVATATIAAYLGLGGLGRYLLDGLAAGDYAQTAGGAILVALLAVALDGVLALGRLLIVPRGLTLTPAH